MLIYTLPTDIFRYHIFPLLDRAERICFSTAILRFPFPKSITSDQVKDVTKHSKHFVRPFLRCFLVLEPEYLHALKPKFMRKRQPRLENALTLFAAYNNNWELIDRQKHKRQFWFGHAEGGKYPLFPWSNPLERYGQPCLRLILKGENLYWLKHIARCPWVKINVSPQKFVRAVREAGLVEKLLSILDLYEMRRWREWVSDTW